VVSLALKPVGPVPFYFTPLVLGLTYLAAAATTGRQGTLWRPGCVITLWGVAVALEFSHTTHADFTSVAVTALGAGATIAALLRRVGVRTDPLAIALSVLFAECHQARRPAGSGGHHPRLVLRHLARPVDRQRPRPAVPTTSPRHHE